MNTKQEECPVCFEPVSAQILLCVTGHSFCVACTKLIKVCPLCTKQMTTIRNLTLERAMQTTYLERRCPASTNCNTSTNLTDLYSHLKTEHTVDFISSKSKSKIILFIKLESQNQSFLFKLIYCSGRFFKFCAKLNERTKMVHCTLIALRQACDGMFEIINDSRSCVSKYSARIGYLSDDDPFQSIDYVVLPKLVIAKHDCNGGKVLEMYLNLKF
ncbi:hypothetical protein FQR65_LT09706 [Abscondita terminalis]|nr:hypothetical protein FQR65_LT09706 [Abscondita terminalis]